MKFSSATNRSSHQNNGVFRQPLFLFGVSTLSFTLDRVLKIWFIRSYPDHVSFNTGLSFNIAAPQTLIFTILTISAALFVYFLKKNAKLLNTGSFVGLALIAGGALGNAYDRIRFGGVIDIFKLWISWFNLADAFIIIGLLLVLMSVDRPHRLGPRR